MRMSSLEISQAVDAVQTPTRSAIFPAGYSIDSRTVQSGECFIAIRGPNFDGHQFIPEALGKGASLIVAQAEAKRAWSTAAPVIYVEDTLVALQRLANYARSKWGRKVIAITGSTGKTTTKEIVGSILAARFRVFKSMGNFNNDFGLPLSLLRLHEQQDIAVLELGMSAPGEIARLSKIAKPDIGIVTNVKPVHLEFFNSIQGIARAKRELIEQLPGDGVAVLNNDDTRVRQFGRYFPGRILTYGVQTAASYRVPEIRFSGLRGTEFRLDHRDRSYLFTLPLIGIHNVYNCLPAIAVAHHLGLGFEAIDHRMKRLTPSPGRGETLSFTDGFQVINDSYNSNPAALEIMIRFLKQVPHQKRRILVAGEMLELGPGSSEFHRNSGKIAAKAKLDLIVGVQGEACRIIEAAKEEGISGHRAIFFESSVAAGEWLSREVKVGDLILLKGSRGVKTEQVIEILKRDHPMLPKE